MSELVHPETPYSIVEREPPEILGANLRVGTHLLTSATAFFFVPFLFAYFYLRSLDSHSAFRPKHVAPSTTLGTLSAGAIVAAAALVWLALADHRADRRPAWRRKGAVALLFLLASVALQIAAWATQGFGPTDGAYASVYVGWTGMLSLFVLALSFWLETTLAISIRFRNTPLARPPRLARRGTVTAQLRTSTIRCRSSVPSSRLCRSSRSRSAVSLS